MAANALPPLPARHVAGLPQLPPRGNQPSSHTPEATEPTPSALPPLPARSADHTLGSRSPSPSTPNSASSLVSTPKTASSLPPLPQRQEKEHQTSQTSNSSSPAQFSSPTDPSPSSQFNSHTVNANNHASSDRISVHAPQPALPPRSGPSAAQPSSSLAIPPLPARNSQSVSPPPPTSSTTELPQLPSRRTQSYAPPPQAFHAPPPALPPSVGVNDHRASVYGAQATPSPVLGSHSSPSHSQPPILPPSLPAHQQVPNANGSARTPSPPLPAHPSSTGAPTNFHSSGQVSHPPSLPPPNAQHAPHTPSVSNGPPPALPQSVPALPSLPKRNAESSPRTPTGGYASGGREASKSVSVAPSRSAAPPPPINRASQPSPGGGGHSAQVVGSSSGGGMYLGSMQNRNADASSSSPSPRASVNKAPLIPASSAPPKLPPSLPPSLPPTNAGASPARDRPISSGPPPALPPSLPASAPQIPSRASVAPPAITAPKVVVVPGSPATRQRSKSFDASGPAPPLPASRSATPEPSKSDKKKKSQLVVPGRSAEAPAASSSSSSSSNSSKDTEHKGGRKRANSAASDDGFAAIVRDITGDHVADGRYTIMVLSPQKQAKIMGESDYVMMYPVEVKKGSQTWTIFRRYKQFYALDNDFKRLHLYKKSGFNSPIPPKTNGNVSKKDPLLLESRRRGFQKYLTDICETQMLADSDTFYMFIQPLQMGDIKPK